MDRIAPRQQPSQEFDATTHIDTVDSSQVGIFDRAGGMEKNRDLNSRPQSRREETEENLRKIIEEEREARQNAERLLAEKEELLARHDVFMREVDHRVKNSLQIVASMLGFQARHVQEPAAAIALEEALQRVLAIASVHEQLFRIGNLEQIDMKVFLTSLCGALASNRPDNVEVRTADVAAIKIPSNYATKIGLIVTELVVNSYKHAFPNDRRGRITISLIALEHSLELIVADDGAGLPDDFTINRRRGLGMRLINSVLSQLGGKLSTIGGNGTRFVIHFPRTLLTSVA
ncbi:MAG: hypothetical protein BGP04_03085 [Rhizobiales bacterium 62-17]|nr:sensor histidine kinase [Hyphomicrobiales bacterium]OJY04401.1 MAG: hypothetical protein BGP04_03085 [Rhizobiales bacterium 62-17]